MKIVSYCIGSFLTPLYVEHYIDYTVLRKTHQNQFNTSKQYKNRSNENTNHKHRSDRKNDVI